MNQLDLFEYPATCCIILLNILVFAMVNLKVVSTRKLGSSYMDTLQNHQYYRIVTSAFTQKEIMHLFCNMYSLYNIGRALEHALDTWLYALCYGVIMIVGGLLSVRVKKRHEPFTLSIGASGVICGLLGIYMVIAFSVWGFGGIRSMIPTIVILVAMTMSKRIDSIGHFTGLLTGIICGLVIIHIYSFGV